MPHARLYAFNHTRIGKYLTEGSVRWEIRTKGTTGGHVGENQKTDLLAIMAGDHDVLGHRCQRTERLDAQAADMHPGARHQLEVLGNPAVELYAFGWIVRIGKTPGITDHVEAFFVEGRTRQIVALPVARGHIGTSHAHFHLGRGGNHLDLRSRRWQTNHAGTLNREMHRGNHR